MAKRDKNKTYFEITKEKPYGSFHMMMVGGAAGSVLGFLVISLVGAYDGMEMDTLVLWFLVASFLGFFFGALLTWLCVKYLGEVLNSSSLLGTSFETEESGREVPAVSEESPVLENEEAKGKSVDFVFPEFSADQQ